MTDRQQILITPPEPHSRKQQFIMEAFMHPGVSEVYVACGTKFGKSISGSAALANGVAGDYDSVSRWVAPIYDQAVDVGMDYMKRMLPPEPEVAIDRGKLTITIPSNKAVIEFWHAQHPTSLEGPAIKRYVFDEAAKIKEDAYASAKTTRTFTRGPMLIMSTPFGKNWFYRKCMEARDDMLWAKRKGKVPSRWFITATTADNPFVPRESIAEAKRDLPDRLFRQYYLAEFVDSGSVFSGFRSCFYGHVLNFEGEHQRWVADGAEEMTVVIGADWAKSVDWTVFFAIDVQTGRVIAFERFHRRTYREAIRQLARFGRKFKEVLMAYHDKTGVGEAIDEQLAYIEMPTQGIVFMNASKADMVNRLITSFENARIEIPRWSILEKELDAFEVNVTASANLTYSAPKGQHDDCVAALLLAHLALLNYAERDMDVKFIDELQSETDGKPSALEAFYNDLVEDETW